MADSPTSLSLEFLRRTGHIAWVVERWLPIPGRKIKQDCFWFGDILSSKPKSTLKGAFLVQTTTKEHMNARKNKILKIEKIRDYASGWLASGNHVIVHGWVKRAGVWTLFSEFLTSEMTWEPERPTW